MAVLTVVIAAVLGDVALLFYSMRKQRELRDAAAGVAMVAMALSSPNANELWLLAPDPEDVPAAEGATAMGRRLALERRARVLAVTESRDGVALLRETLDPLPSTALEWVIEAPQYMVLFSLLFAILGLIAAIHGLATSLHTGQLTSRPFDFVWMAFVPTALGLGSSLAYGGWFSRRAVDEWHTAERDLDEQLIEAVMTQRSAGDANLDEAAERLVEASGQLGNVVGSMQKQVDRLTDKVSNLDTSAVSEQMVKAASSFQMALKGSAGDLVQAGRSLATTSKTLGEQMEAIQGTTSSVEATTKNLEHTANSIGVVFEGLQGMGDQLVNSLEPVGKAADRIRAGLEDLTEAQMQLQQASGELKQNTADLSTAVRNELIPEVKKLGDIHAPVAQSLTTTSGQLQDATDKFSRLVEELQANQALVREELQSVSKAIGESSAAMSETTAGWRKLVEGSLVGQQEFSNQVVSAMVSTLAESPPDVAALSEAARGLSTASNSIAREVASLPQSVAQLRQVVDGFREHIEQREAQFKDTWSTAAAHAERTGAQTSELTRALSDGIRNLQAIMADLPTTMSQSLEAANTDLAKAAKGVLAAGQAARDSGPPVSAKTLADMANQLRLLVEETRRATGTSVSPAQRTWGALRWVATAAVIVGSSLYLSMSLSTALAAAARTALSSAVLGAPGG